LQGGLTRGRTKMEEREKVVDVCLEFCIFKVVVTSRLFLDEFNMARFCFCEKTNRLFERFFFD
jgi:hypothetical protein